MFTVPLVCTGTIGTSTCHMALSHLPVSPDSELLREGSVSGAVGAQSLSREQKLGFSDLHTQQDHLPQQETQISFFLCLSQSYVHIPLIMCSSCGKYDSKCLLVKYKWLLNANVLPWA